MAAVEVGLFTAISRGAGTYEEVARALDIHPTNAERLMVMLCAAGLIEKQEGRHRNAADVERFLVEGKPGYMGPWITFTKPQWNEWGRLGEHIRNKNLKVMGAIETFTAADARRYHNATYSIGMGAGRRFVRQVDLARRRRIMDIGGGSGAYCIAAAKEHAAYPRRGAGPACGVRGGTRVHRRERRRRPRRGSRLRLHARPLPRRLRCRHHGLQPAHVQPRDDRQRHQESTRRAAAGRRDASHRRDHQRRAHRPVGARLLGPRPGRRRLARASPTRKPT